MASRTCLAHSARAWAEVNPRFQTPLPCSSDQARLLVLPRPGTLSQCAVCLHGPTRRVSRQWSPLPEGGRAGGAGGDSRRTRRVTTSGCGCPALGGGPEFVAPARRSGLSIVTSDAFAVGPSPPEAVRVPGALPDRRHGVDQGLEEAAVVHVRGAEQERDSSTRAGPTGPVRRLLDRGGCWGPAAKSAEEPAPIQLGDRGEPGGDREAGRGRAPGVADRRARAHGLGPDQGPRARAAGSYC
jgi:hypothetical protein